MKNPIRVKELSHPPVFSIDLFDSPESLPQGWGVEAEKERFTQGVEDLTSGLFWQ
jgi:hypothetical protein